MNIFKIFRKERTDFKKPIKKITDKHTIVDFAIIYLKHTGSLIDMNGFIHSEMNYPDAPTSFIRDVAYLMWGTGKYDFADTYKKDEYLLCKKQSWIARNPIGYAIFLGILSAAISFAVTKLTPQQDNTQLQHKKDIIQDSTILQLQQEFYYLRDKIEQTKANTTDTVKKN
ncbi:hypothetical protein [Flavobacterium sp.]|uniref:hypothetical protein n=1 Tax=Flavobacterium sp. TaxID=239 RepID=UPI00374D6759